MSVDVKDGDTIGLFIVNNSKKGNDGKHPMVFIDKVTIVGEL